MGRKLIALGHGYDKKGNYDPGAVGNGETEAGFLRGKFLKSLKKYAGEDVDFYDGNMFMNREAATIKGYDEVIELHLDAASPSAKGGHVILFKGFNPDLLDRKIGSILQNHFGLRGGKMFDHRDNLLNLNVFARRGIAYRLVELGFITNAENMQHFDRHYDLIAKELIEVITGKSIKTTQPTIEEFKHSHIGKRVESIHGGPLNFYNIASWDAKHRVGTISKGYGFPTVIAKVKVGPAYQYRVVNSKGATFYITASSKYVKLL